MGVSQLRAGSKKKSSALKKFLPHACGALERLGFKIATTPAPG